MALSAKKKKSFAEYNCVDVLSVWNKRYLDIFGEYYSTSQFIGYDQNMLKELLEGYGIYDILLAIDSALQNGCSNIKYFYDAVEKYLPNSKYSKYYYLIEKYGTKDLQKELIDLSVLESKWSPSSNTMDMIDRIVDKFETFLQAKNLP